MDIFTVAFFGHRDFNAHRVCERKMDNIIKELINSKEYVDFIVGKNGEFDSFSASAVRRAKKECWSKNSSLILCLPYVTAEYRNNTKFFDEYYDETEICTEAEEAYFKNAIGIRNRHMVERADLIICYIEKESGGAYSAVKYTKGKGIQVINLAKNEGIR